MRLTCTDCHKEGQHPFEDSAPYGERNGVCAEHGPGKVPDYTHFARNPIKDFRPGDTYDLIPSRRWVGMEFEMYHRTGVTNRVMDLSRDWRLLSCGVSEDGSISSRANIEIKTPPAQGDDAALWAKAVGTICPSYGMMVNKSCGLHVHVDIRDYGALAMKRLGLLAMAVEPVLYAALPPDRRERGMSSPLAIDRDRLYRANGEAVENVWWSRVSGRHYGLNMHARDEHGTVEFRYHSGTLNPEKVKHWIRICTGLVDAAADTARVAQRVFGVAPKDFADRLDLLQHATMMPGDTLAYLMRRITQFKQDGKLLHERSMMLTEAPQIIDLEMPPDWPLHGARLAGTEQRYCRLHMVYEEFNQSCYNHYEHGLINMSVDHPWPVLGKWLAWGGDPQVNHWQFVFACPVHLMLEGSSHCAMRPTDMLYVALRSHRRSATTPRS